MPVQPLIRFATARRASLVAGRQL